MSNVKLRRRSRRALLAGVPLAALVVAVFVTAAGAVAPIGPVPTPDHTVTLDASPVDGLANGSAVTFSVHTTGGTTLVGNLTAHLCVHGFTSYGVTNFGYDGSTASRCIFQPNIVSGGLTGADYEKVFGPYAGSETTSGNLTFHVGTGSVTWGNNTGYGPFTATADATHQLDLVIQVNLSGDSVPVTYFIQPLSFGPTVPKAPTAVRAAPRPTSNTHTGPIAVTYTAGASGGSAITRFTATCTSSDGGVKVSGVHVGGSAATITVGGASLKRLYTCKVSATNAKGVGPASVASGIVTVGAPAQVAKPSVSRTGKGKLRVAFHKLSGGATNGSALTTPKYSVRCVATNGGATRTATGTSSAISVGSLSPGRTYTCTVRAHNARGYGQASPPSAPHAA